MVTNIMVSEYPVLPKLLILCNGGADGDHCQFPGGYSFLYLWSNLPGKFYQWVWKGDYALTVVDETRREGSSLGFSITEPAPMELQVLSAPATNGEMNGTATVEASAFLLYVLLEYAT